MNKECIDEALAALKNFSAEELREYAGDVFEKAKGYQNVSNAAAFEKAMQEINNDRLKAYFESAMTAANNALKVESIAERIRTGKASVANSLVRLHGSQGDNVVAAQRAATEKMEGLFFNKVTQEETAYLTSGDNDLAIADAYDGKKVDHPIAKKIADLWNKIYFPERNAEMVTSNAMPFNHINEDRSFRNVHDSNKLIMGGRSGIDEARSKKKFTTQEAKQKWVETVKKHFDLVHSDAIDSKGNVDQARVDEIIGDMYDNITTGKSDITTRSMVVNDRHAMANLSRRRLQPKSMRNFVEYNKEYGQGNLINAMLTDMHSSGNKIGRAQFLGDSPEAAYFDLRKVQQESEATRKGTAWWHQTDIYFKEIMGSNKTAVSPTLAAIDANIRSWTAMARLGFTITLRSIPDVNYMATFAMNHGYNYFSAWGTHLKNLFDLYPSEERKFLAQSYASMFRQQLGHLQRFGEANNASERTSKISTAFFKINLLHGLDQSQKMSGLQLVARGLGRSAGKTFDQLPLARKNWVAKFLEPHEWDMLRTKTQKKLFTVDTVDALSEKEVRELYNAGDKIRPLHEYRNDLYRKVHAMSQVATENMVLNPGAFEKAFLLQGTRTGTPVGTLLRQVAHFKSYTLSFIDKVLIQGYKSADANQQKLAWATATMIGGLPLTYAVMFFENLAMGKSMPDPTKMSPAEAEQFLLQLIMPGMALFSGMLDPKHQNADMTWSLLGSPSLRMIGNAMGTAGAIVGLNPKLAMKNFEHLLSYLLPIKSTPVLSPLLNQAMGEKGHLEPGQKHYFGR